MNVIKVNFHICRTIIVLSLRFIALLVLIVDVKEEGTHNDDFVLVTYDEVKDMNSDDSRFAELKAAFMVKKYFTPCMVEDGSVAMQRGCTGRACKGVSVHFKVTTNIGKGSPICALMKRKGYNLYY